MMTRVETLDADELQRIHDIVAEKVPKDMMDYIKTEGNIYKTK